MQKSKILLLLLLIPLLFTRTVDALEIKNSDFYVNQNNISISNQELLNLKGLGFTDEQIAEMDQEEFNKNKNLQSELLLVDTKYYKTTTIYEYTNNNTNSFLNNNMLESNNFKTIVNNNFLRLEKTYSEEISKKEYENAKNASIMSTMDANPNIVETSYKKLSTSISKNGDYYRLKNDLTWKNMPKVRNYDVFGIRNNTYMSPVSGSQYSKLSYTIKNNCSGTSSNHYKSYSSNSDRWKKDTDGYGLSFELPEDTISYYSWGGLGQPTTCPCINPPAFGTSISRTNDAVKLSSYMYFDVAKIGAGKVNVIDAFGSYQHATTKISSSISLSFSIEAYGLGAVLAFSSNNDKFDGMAGTHAQILNANW